MFFTLFVSLSPSLFVYRFIETESNDDQLALAPRLLGAQLDTDLQLLIRKENLFVEKRRNVHHFFFLWSDIVVHHPIQPERTADEIDTTVKIGSWPFNNYGTTQSVRLERQLSA